MSAPTVAGAGRAALLLGALLWHPADVNALGFRVPNEDAEAIARGNAFTATADNPSAIYYNPAGITQLDGQNLQYGVHAISINSFYNSPSGGSSESKFAVQAVPSLYYTCTPKDLPVSFGVGLYAPYGLGLQWPVGSTFRTSSVFEGQLTYITLNPVVAWKVCDQLSLAVGPTMDYSQVLLRQGIPAMFGGQFKFRGEDVAFGYTAGLMWQPFEKWSFGAKYNSATTMKYSGSSSTYSTSTHANAEVPFAQFFTVGISYRPNADWNFETDFDWTDWSSMKTINFNNTPLGNVPFALNWKPSVLVEAGVTRYLKNGYWVGAGYFFSQNSTTDRDFTPIVPDTDLHVGSLGFGHKGERWAWALSAQIITGPDRTVTGNTNPNVDGRYQWVNASANFSIAYHFN